jgi:preprotein translocase subunit SecE
MNSQVEASRGMNTILWVVTIALISAGVVGNMYYADQSLLYRVIGLVALGLVAIFVVLKTDQGGAFAAPQIWRQALVQLNQ